jgi:hypothetical protein
VTALHGFNWFTALIIAVTWPATLWCSRHIGQHRAAFRQLVRALVFRLVESRLGLSRQMRMRAALGSGLALVGIALLAAARIDVRLPSPADFDTLSRVRQLLNGTTTWDPLASLAAVTIHVAATDALSAMRAIRMALVAWTAFAAGQLIMEGFGVRSGRGAVAVAPLALAVAAPTAPLGTWAIGLVLLIGATSLLRSIRDRCLQDGWHALAALVLAVALAVPFAGHSGALTQVSVRAHYLEYRAAAHTALQLGRLPPEEDWVLAGPPEQQLETGGRGRFIDLARFVARFRDRAGAESFRFDLGRGRLFVLVEKEALDVSRPLPGVQFVAAQPAAYRVPRERARLARLARQICDDYRRTHVGTAIVYDDVQLRVYRFDL